jgi:hypothetical protein
MIRQLIDGSLMALIGVLALCSGCDRTPPGRLPTYEVNGSVTYKGKPLPQADVLLMYPELQKTSFARSDEEGNFRLATYETADGALAGKALISVSKYEQVPVSKDPIAGEPGYDPSKAYLPEKPAKSLIPDRYASFDKSELTTVIEASDSNSPLVIELKD